MASENLHPLEELKRLDQQVEEATQLADLKSIFYRLEEIAKQHSADFEVQLVVGDVKQHVVNRGTRLKEQSQGVPDPAPLFFSTSSPDDRPTMDITAEKPVPAASAPPPPQPPGRTPEPPTMVIPSPLLSGQFDAPKAPASDSDLPDDLRPKRLVSSGQFSPPGQPAMPPPAAPPPPPQAAKPPAVPPPIPPSVPPPPTSAGVPKPDAPTRVIQPGTLPTAKAGDPTVVIRPEARKDIPSVPPKGAGTPPPLTPVGGVGPNGPQNAGPVGTGAPPNKPPVNAPPPGGGGPNWKRALGVGALVGLLLAAVGVGIVWYLAKRQDPAGGFVSVQIATTPPGAAIRVNGEPNCTSDCVAELPSGTYQITALLDGYEPAASEITVEQAGGTRSLTLPLTPQAQTVRILADINQGTVTMDGQPAGALQDGQFVAERVPPGPHTFKVSSGVNEATFSVDLADARMPAVTGAVNTRNLLAVIVTSFANQARVVTSSGPMKLVVNGQEQGQASPSGVDLTNYQAGVAEMVLGEGTQARTMQESFGPAPMVTAFLKSDANVGTLIVATGENDVRVFLNDREYTRRTSRGQLRVQVPAGRVTIRVTKDGFEELMPQTVTVAKGSETRVTFNMRALPEFSSLEISGGTPGAEVVIDGNVVGTLAPSTGGFRNRSIEPGAHVIELRRVGFQPKRFERTFRRGQAVSLTAEEATLAAVVRETPPPPPPPKPKSDPAPPKVSQAPKPRTGTMANFDAPEAWREEEGVWRHRGAAHLTYGITPPNGVFSFTIHRIRGGNLFRSGRVRWMIQYKDARNYAFYEMDDETFWSKVQVDGKTLERTKIKHGLDKDLRAWPIQVDLSPQRAQIRAQRDGEWVILDTWTEPGRNFTDGKFGILVNGNDEVGLTDFRFTGR